MYLYKWSTNSLKRVNGEHKLLNEKKKERKDTKSKIHVNKGYGRYLCNVGDKEATDKEIIQSMKSTMKIIAK